MLRRAASLLLFVPALHAQIALGPERFVCDPIFEGPYIEATAAATNGRDTLVVVQTGTGYWKPLYAQRLGAQGQPLTEHGMPLQIRRNPTARASAIRICRLLRSARKRAACDGRFFKMQDQKGALKNDR
jgi:hypothetical protein